MTTSDIPQAGEQDDLLDRLRRLMSKVDPVPAEATLAARSALAHLNLDAALAELLEHDEVMAGVRSVGAPEALIFECDDLSIDVEVQRTEDGLWLQGQVLGPAPSRVTLHQPGMPSTDLSVDELGRFGGSAQPGPARLGLSCVDSKLVLTSWVTL